MTEKRRAHEQDRRAGHGVRRHEGRPVDTAGGASRDKASISAWLNLSIVRRQLGDLDGAFAALREVLKLDSRNFRRCSCKPQCWTGWGKRIPRPRPTASRSPRRRRTRLEAATRQAIQRAQEVHGKYIGELGNYIRDRAAEARDRCTPAERRRLESFIDTTLANAQALPAGTDGVLLPGPAGDRVLRARGVSLAAGIRVGNRVDLFRTRADPG